MKLVLHPTLQKVLKFKRIITFIQLKEIFTKSHKKPPIPVIVAVILQV